MYSSWDSVSADELSSMVRCLTDMLRSQLGEIERLLTVDSIF